MPFILLSLAVVAAGAQVGNESGRIDGEAVVTSVDWESGTVIVSVSRAVPTETTNSPSAISRVQAQIERDAPAIVAGELLALTYNSYYTIGQLVDENESLIRRVLEAASLARAVDARSSTDLKWAEVTFRLNLHADIASLFVRHTYTDALPAILRWVPTADYTGIVIYAAEPLPIHGTDRREYVRRRRSLRRFHRAPFHRRRRRHSFLQSSRHRHRLYR